MSETGPLQLPEIVVTPESPGFVPGSPGQPANVPSAPGVPVINSITPSGANPTILTTDPIAILGVLGPQWGIFSGGVEVIAAQSVATFEYRQDWTVADYPVEGGTFESYDKVALPFLAKVRYAQGGNLTQRSQFLQSIAAIAGTFNLYNVVTPEAIYLNCNVSHYDYRRTATQGVGLIQVDIWLTQIIQQNSGTLGSTQSTSGFDPVTTGQVGTIPATTQQTSDASAADLVNEGGTP